MKKLSDQDVTQRVNAFGDLIHAAMMDAAIERKITQFKAELDPRGNGKMAQVRIVVMPEMMDIEQPGGFRAP